MARARFSISTESGRSSVSGGSDGADGVADAAQHRAGVEGLAVAQGFGGGQQFDGGDVLAILHDGAEFEGGGHAHGDVVLLPAGGGDVIDAGGMGQHLAFVEQRRRRRRGRS